MPDDTGDAPSVNIEGVIVSAPQNVAPIIAPDGDTMLEHLTMLFGRAQAGRIEITALHTDKSARYTPRTKFFNADELEEAAAHSVALNCEPGWNVYVGAALRIDEVFPGQAADDKDFLESYAVWADADDGDQMAIARQIYRDHLITPAMVVVTGRTPSTRAQLWWPLENPIRDISTLRSTVRGIASALGTDGRVCTGKQLMRLAGGLNWPKKDGRVLERTQIIIPQNANREFMLEQVHRAFPPIEQSASGDIGDVVIEQTGSLGLTEQVMDGRELYAFRLVRAHLREWIGTTGSEPTADELYKSAAPVYLKKADQVRPGRGPQFLKQKCVEALRSFTEGAIPGMKTLDEAVLTWAERHHETPDVIQDDDVEIEDADLFEVLSMADIKALPDVEWLIDDIIPSASLGFLYAAPGSYKTFLCYDLALSLAYGFSTWLDKKIAHPGSVLYIASEGSAGVKNRIIAWQKKHEVTADSDRFRLIRKTMSFMDRTDIDRLERTVAAIVEQYGPIGMVFVDTVSRVLPGADENLQKDMTVFVAACDRIRERFNATVIGVHHTNKNGDMRGSTVFLGQGDFIFRINKHENSGSGELICEKQKDAEDGWKKQFTVEKIEWLPLGRIKNASSLVVAFGENEVPQNDKWPSREVLKSLWLGINSAWESGRPLSMHPQTIKDGRYAPRTLSATHNVSSEIVKMVVDEWLAHEVVIVETTDRHSKIKGLKTAKSID